MKAEQIQGWMAPDELDQLRAWAKNYQTVIEVGCWKGRSTLAFCEACPGEVFAVDHFRGSPDERTTTQTEAAQYPYSTLKELCCNCKEHLESGKLKVMVMESLRAAQLFYSPSNPAMVFIDASHFYEAVLADLKAWYQPESKHFYCGHDAGYPSVDKALDEVFPNRWHRVGAGSLWYVE